MFRGYPYGVEGTDNCSQCFNDHNQNLV